MEHTCAQETQTGTAATATGREGSAKGLALGKATRGVARLPEQLSATCECVMGVKQTQKGTQTAGEGWRISITAVPTVAGRPASR